MDTNDILDGDFGDGITMQTRDLNYLRTAGKWGQFISIAGLILIAVGVVVMLIGGASSLMMMGSMGGAFSLFLIPYLIIFGVIIYLYILMYQFSTNAVTAASGKSKSALTDALKALASMFKLGGILLLLYFGLMVIGVISSIAMAVSF